MTERRQLDSHERKLAFQSIGRLALFGPARKRHVRRRPFLGRKEPARVEPCRLTMQMIVAVPDGISRACTLCAATFSDSIEHDRRRAGEKGGFASCT
jgi:hypothetical protein